MQKIKTFLKTSLLGGILIILPVVILVFVFKWIFDFVTDCIQPLTDMLIFKSQMHEIFADLIVIAIILSICFLVGAFVKTTLGTYIFQLFENNILKIAPGYTIIKDTVMHFFGKKESFFSSVALVQLFCNETLATAFITDSHRDGSFTVFVPTGPNPTSGNIFHLKNKYVHHVDVPVEEAMRSIISCGAGSTRLFENYLEKIKTNGGKK